MSVNVAKSTVVLAGKTVSPDLPLEVCNCTDTNPTRYARKLSVDAVLVIVTMAVPLQAASANIAAPHAPRNVKKRLERDSFICRIDLFGQLLFSDYPRFCSGYMKKFIA